MRAFVSARELVWKDWVPPGSEGRLDVHDAVGEGDAISCAGTPSIRATATYNASRRRGRVDGHASADGVDRERVEERRHVVERVDHDADLAHLAERPRVVGVTIPTLEPVRPFRRTARSTNDALSKTIWPWPRCAPEAAGRDGGASRERAIPTSYVEDLAAAPVERQGYVVARNLWIRLPKNIGEHSPHWTDIDIFAVGAKDVVICSCKALLVARAGEDRFPVMSTRDQVSLYKQIWAKHADPALVAAALGALRAC